MRERAGTRSRVWSERARHVYQRAKENKETRRRQMQWFMQEVQAGARRLKLRLDAVLAGMKELLAHLLETYANHQREQEAHRQAQEETERAKQRSGKGRQGKTQGSKAKGSKGSSNDSKCPHVFRRLSDDKIVRMFSGGSILGLSTCSRKSARKAFHALSLQYHPDKAKNNKMDKQCAEENFMDLQAAYTRAQALC